MTISPTCGNLLKIKEESLNDWEVWNCFQKQFNPAINSLPWITGLYKPHPQGAATHQQNNYRQDFTHFISYTDRKITHSDSHQTLLRIKSGTPHFYSALTQVRLSLHVAFYLAPFVCVLPLFVKTTFSGRLHTNSKFSQVFTRYDIFHKTTYFSPGNTNFIHKKN